VALPLEVQEPHHRPWAILGTAETRRNLISSIYLSHDALEHHERALQAKYDVLRAREVRYQEIATDDAEILLVGYGIVSRVLRRTVTLLRREGIRAGLLRPLTVWPFPAVEIGDLAAGVERVLVAELSAGQMVEDVRLAVKERCPVHFYGRMGGNVPSAEEVADEVRRLLGGGRHHESVDEWSVASAAGMEADDHATAA
jgi:pyruvate/2-oxoacid:ferredoxin oxidoreductase alpha subunit